MPQTAYEFSRFEQRAEAPSQKPRVRVAKGSSRRASAQLKQMLRTMLLCTVVVVLAVGVLYTQTSITELQSQIAGAEKQMNELKTVHDYLNGELEKMVNLRTLDERAQALGLVQMDHSKVNYIRVNDGDAIQVKKSTLEQLLEDIQARFLSIWEYLE